MKIVYCIHAVSNSGGMERTLQQNANYLADILGYEIVIITTEQKGKKPFFSFSSKIRFIDLGVDYGDVSLRDNRNIFWKVIWKNLHKPLHKKKLTEVLQKEKADFVITLFNNDIGFLPSIKDGSKKIAWFHFTYTYKSIAARNGVVRMVQYLRRWIWKRDFSRFDHFVVLTEEDKKAWGDMPNIKVIPNFVPSIPEEQSPLLSKRVIAVGRADYQKGFDMLIKAWGIVAKKYPDWRLDIFGNGEKSGLEELIRQNELQSCISLHSATKDIASKYVNSSLYVLSSRYEGLPMVLLEAMSYGLPIVSFECPCGPKDIIRDDFGTLVPNGDIQALADAMMKWMSDEDLRIQGGYAARIAIRQYTQESVMAKWLFLLNS